MYIDRLGTDQINYHLQIDLVDIRTTASLLQPILVNKRMGLNIFFCFLQNRFNPLIQYDLQQSDMVVVHLLTYHFMQFFHWTAADMGGFFFEEAMELGQFYLSLEINLEDEVDGIFGQLFFVFQTWVIINFSELKFSMFSSQFSKIEVVALSLCLGEVGIGYN